MKSYVSVLAVLLLTVSVFSGCSRDNEAEPFNPPSNTDSLISELRVAYQFGSSVDSAAKLEFQYDAGNRLNMVKGYYYDLGAWHIEYTSRYFYNGSDTLPLRMSTTGTGFSSEVFFFFNNMGFLVKDSIIEGSGYFVEADREIAAGIEHRISELYMGNLIVDYDTLAQVRNGAQILRETSLASGERVDYEYDTYRNPFNAIPELRKLAFSYSEMPILGGPNNLRRATFSGGGISDMSTIVYTYNTAGFPVNFTETVQSNPGEIHHFALKYQAKN